VLGKPGTQLCPGYRAAVFRDRPGRSPRTTAGLAADRDAVSFADIELARLLAFACAVKAASA
jgi:hypothetical protein